MTLCKYNFVMHPHHNYGNSNNKMPIRMRKTGSDKSKGREKGNTDRPKKKTQIGFGISAAISICYDAVVLETWRNLR